MILLDSLSYYAKFIKLAVYIYYIFGIRRWLATVIKNDFCCVIFFRFFIYRKWKITKYIKILEKIASDKDVWKSHKQETDAYKELYRQKKLMFLARLNFLCYLDFKIRCISKFLTVYITQLNI